jgi:hypothetical protein
LGKKIETNRGSDRKNDSIFQKINDCIFSHQDVEKLLIQLNFAAKLCISRAKRVNKE